MKQTKFIVHGAIVFGGLLLGLLLRGGVKIKEQQVSTTDTKSVVSRTVGKAALGSQLHEVERILAKGSGVGLLGLSREDQALLKYSLFHLELSDYPVALNALLDGDFKSYRLRSLASGLFAEWGKKEPLQALKALDRVPAEIRPDLARMVYLGWAFTDANASFEHAERHTPRLQGEILEGMMLMWSDFAEERPEQALARLAHLKKEDVNRESVQEEVIGRIGYERPDLALDWMMNHLEGVELKEGLSSLISSWGAKEPQKVFQFVTDLPEELQSSRIFEELGSSFYGGSEHALARAENLPEVYRENFLRGVVENLVSTRPFEATEVVKALPEGEIRKTAYRELSADWGRYDPVAAGEWLLTLSRSASRDSAIQGFTRAILDVQPEAAAEWVLEIDDPVNRKDEMRRFAHIWLEKDKTAVKEWIRQQSLADFPEEMRERLLSDK